MIPTSRRRFLRTLHRSACKVFGTVLGPDSDRWHRNHFHFSGIRPGEHPLTRRYAGRRVGPVHWR